MSNRLVSHAGPRWCWCRRCREHDGRAVKRERRQMKRRERQAVRREIAAES